MSNKIEGKRIALVGGAGFIGHNLALYLKKKGADVHVIDSLQVNNLLYFTSNYKLENRTCYLKILNQRLELLNKSNIQLHIIDARDYHLLSKNLTEISPQIIIHLAAVAHAGKSNKDPYKTFDHSLRTLENTLDYARDTNVEHFMYFSSSMVYGDFLTEEVDEEHPLNSKGIYGALKVAGEKMVTAYNQVFDLPYTIIRPSALYGPRCVSRRVGQIFIENALKGEKLKVKGDGEEKIDFTHINDLIEGIALIIQKPEAKNQVFNLTYGRASSINNLIKIIKNEFPNVEVEYTERDKLIPFRGTLSVKKARDLLGYNPQNPVEIGFPKYIEWYKSFETLGDNLSEEGK